MDRLGSEAVAIGSETVGIGAEADVHISELFASAERWRPTLEA